MFSGGIDSLYTLWAHQSENQPLEEYRVTHCIFLNGFDISLLYPHDFEAAQAKFERMAELLNIDLVTCRSNLHSFTEGRSPWLMAYISPLLAPIFGVSRLFNKLLVASPFHYNDLMPTGVTPVTDHLFSTESLQVIHHGADKVKPYKLEAIADWKPAQQNMRVCVDQEKRLGVQNCGECFKCLRTRVNLKMVGVSGFETIPEGASLGVMLRWALRIHAYGPWAQEMTRFAVDRKKWGYLPLYFFAYIISWFKRLLRMLMPKWFFLWLRARLYPPHKNPFLHSTIAAKDKGSLDDHLSS
jgi:hypothetical protein